MEASDRASIAQVIRLYVISGFSHKYSYGYARSDLRLDLLHNLWGHLTNHHSGLKCSKVQGDAEEF